ncbi:hypothetical protein GCM10008938_10100 [Deinococcus roseus]|uniref:Uncharacterized protein n=1 Tax=Deinococcus roseus TaxID=392414 RepID=A0ABQ2CX77_9DEIO|nr:hypothetical protein GCM10008938_10100 [Deinococcus roseus]
MGVLFALQNIKKLIVIARLDIFMMFMLHNFGVQKSSGPQKTASHLISLISLISEWIQRVSHTRNHLLTLGITT